MEVNPSFQSTACALLLASTSLSGCVTIQDHGDRDPNRIGTVSGSDGDASTAGDGEPGETDKTGGADPKSKLGNAFNVAVEFRDDKHIINTDRGRLVLAREGTPCVHIEQEYSRAASELGIHDAYLEEVFYQSDTDLCGFLDEQQLPDEFPGEQYTIAFVGYDAGASYLSLFGCSQGVSKPADGHSIDLRPVPREGYDNNEPSRCITVNDRCDENPVCPINPDQL